MHTEDLQATAALIHQLSTASATVKQTGNASHVLAPADYQLHDITSVVEKAEPAPSRKRGDVTVGDVASLLAYCADQAAQAAGYIYADVDNRVIVAVFNDQRAAAGWRDHRATFRAELTPEAKRWLSKTGSSNAMAQTEFAEFIEDNIADLQGDEAQKLLTMATTIAATSSINFSSAKRLQDGQTQLVYNEVIDTRAGADGSLQIPKTFSLGLRLFKNGEGYKLTARLKYRLASGNVKFWYELERPENALEDAFKGYVAEVADKSGYTVLMGRP